MCSGGLLTGDIIHATMDIQKNMRPNMCFKHMDTSGTLLTQMYPLADSSRNYSAPNLWAYCTITTVFIGVSS